jgi:hypothetical protein
MMMCKAQTKKMDSVDAVDAEVGSPVDMAPAVVKGSREVPANR